MKKDVYIRPTLVVVDMQNGFVAKGGSYDKMGINTKNYQKIVPNIKRLVNHCRKIGIPVVYTQAVRDKSGSDLLVNYHNILPKSRRERIEKHHLCMDGTWDAKIVDQINPAKNDIVIKKRRDSVFQDTDLDFRLKSLNINTVVFSGIDTSVCVESSLRVAFNRGFDVILISDATAARKRNLYKSTVEVIRENFGLVLTTDQFIKEFDSNGVIKSVKDTEKYMK